MAKRKGRLYFDLAYASSLGIGMVVAIFGGLLIGVWIDGKLGTKKIFSVLFFIFGVAAGFKNLYGFVKRYFIDGTNRSGDGTDGEAGSQKQPPEEN